MKEKKREEGYYFVKQHKHNDWSIGYFSAEPWSEWLLPHGITTYKDKDMAEINENKIELPSD